MRCKIRSTIIAAALTVLPLSCNINRDYDFDKGVDTQVVLAKNLTVPIGDAGSVKTEKMVLLLGYEAVSTDENGDIVLDFSQNNEIVFQFDIAHLGVDFSNDLAYPFAFVLGMDVTNTSPLSFGVSVSLLDSLKQAVPAYRPLVSSRIAAGSADSPTVSPLEVNVVAKRLDPFDCIRFTLSVSAEGIGSTKYTLSDSDRIEFNSLRLSFPEGIPMSMSWIKDMSPYVMMMGFFIKR